MDLNCLKENALRLKLLRAAWYVTTYLLLKTEYFGDGTYVKMDLLSLDVGSGIEL